LIRILIEKVKVVICIESDTGRDAALKFIEGAVDLLKTDVRFILISLIYVYI